MRPRRRRQRMVRRLRPMGATSPARFVETVVVGAGQAGLLASDLLRRQGREHVVLDRRSELGGGWLDRWDAFQLVGPNWTVALDGFPYRGPDPDGFMHRDEVIAHWRAYASAIAAPVELGTSVSRLGAIDHGQRRFHLITTRGEIEARSVVVAAGPFQVPFIPPIASGFDRSIHLLHSHDYRNPASLPPGGVLLIGSGQTGVQLAEELGAAGRAVTMSVGRCGRGPRRYRGQDLFWWLRQLATDGPAVGAPLPSPADLPDPRLRFRCNPQLSGHGEPHDTNLRKMASEGLRLVGRFEAAQGTTARFASDLPGSLHFADTFFQQALQPRLDRFAERTGLDLPDDQLEQFDYEPPVITELDLAREAIATVIWTSGYRPDLGWIELPVLDEFGLPVTRGGQTDVPGLSFIGTPYLVDMASANLVGLERDARALAERWD